MRLKILYVHGYNSGENSATAKNLNKLLKKQLKFEFEIIAPSFSNNILDLRKTLDKINNLVKNEQIQLIVSSSYGCFATLFIDVNHSVKRIFINPCMVPSVEIGKIQNLSEEELEILKLFEEQMVNHKQEIFDCNQIYYISKNDQLFGTDMINRHIDIIKEHIQQHNIHLYNSDSHAPPKEMMKEICDYISQYLDELKTSISE